MMCLIVTMMMGIHALTACATSSAQFAAEQQCAVNLMVLGIAQDGGKPQFGNSDDAAWADLSLKRLATSLAIIDDTQNRKRYLFEATPDIRAQMQALDEAFPVTQSISPNNIGLDGVFLTHAHIGHYTGLMFLGHESVGAKDVAVYAMPKMQDYLASNGPWSQLVKYHNINLQSLSDLTQETIGAIGVTPFTVPHRQEFSEVVGYEISGPEKSALFIPDIDSWEEWDALGTRIEEKIANVDYAFLDATFFANGEIPGRDMSGFPHPFIKHSMERFENLPASEKSKIYFIHMNHTNPALYHASPEAKQVDKSGYNIAFEGQKLCL